MLEKINKEKDKMKERKKERMNEKGSVVIRN